MSAETETGADENLSSEDADFLERYRKELGAGLPGFAALDMFMSDLAQSGDPDARSRLAEKLLPLVPEVAVEFAGQGLPIADLIQEGNLGLMLGIESVSGIFYMEPEELIPLLRGCIINAIEEALSADSAENATGEMVARRVNDLSDRIKELMEDLGGQLSIDELSLYLDMPAGEIEALIRLTGEGSDGGSDDGVES